jgi:hypothetical protein
MTREIKKTSAPLVAYTPPPKPVAMEHKMVREEPMVHTMGGSASKMGGTP